MKALWKWLFNVLIAIDQLANAAFYPLLNWCLNTPPEARFGSPDETLSSVFGKNIRANRCKACKIICKILDVLDPRPGSHCKQSIEDDEQGI